MDERTNKTAPVASAQGGEWVNASPADALRPNDRHAQRPSAEETLPYALAIKRAAAAEKRAAELERERDEARGKLEALREACSPIAGLLNGGSVEMASVTTALRNLQSALAQESAKPASWLREAIDETKSRDVPMSDFAEREIAKIRAEPKPGTDCQCQGERSTCDVCSKPKPGDALKSKLDSVREAWGRPVDDDALASLKEDGWSAIAERATRLQAVLGAHPGEDQAPLPAELGARLAEFDKTLGLLVSFVANCRANAACSIEEAADQFWEELETLEWRPKPGDVLSGEAAKAYMLANPGRRVRAVDDRITYTAFDGGILLRYFDKAEWERSRTFDTMQFEGETYVVLPPEPTKPATPDLDLAGRVGRLEKFARHVLEAFGKLTTEHGDGVATVFGDTSLADALKALEGK